MISATQLKNGTTFLLNGKPFIVKKYEHQKIGRGGATVKLSVRNLETGVLEQKTLNSASKVDAITTIKKPLQYLYKDGQNAVFMDSSTYEQIEIPVKILNDQIPYIKEGETVDVLFWDDKALSVDIAPKITLRVIDTTPNAKGNSATNVFKPAKLENGLEVKVPGFIKTGEKIRIDTRTGEYIERA